MVTARPTVAVAVALIGLIAGCVIYAMASVAPREPLERPEDTKQYLRQMEVYGGRANVLASQAREWFSELWHGKRLAGTVVVLSLVLAAISFVALTPLAEPDRGGEQPAPGSAKRTE